MSPIKSRTDSTFFGSFQGDRTRRRLGEVDGDMSALGYRLNAAGDRRYDGNIVALFESGFEILQETNIVAVHVER